MSWPHLREDVGRARGNLEHVQVAQHVRGLLPGRSLGTFISSRVLSAVSVVARLPWAELRR